MVENAFVILKTKINNQNFDLIDLLFDNFLRSADIDEFQLFLFKNVKSVTNLMD